MTTPGKTASGLASLLVAAAAVVCQAAYGHGGVVEEDDLCVIKINYLKGHFKIYQPRTDGHTEYCEDLPNATESVFVMEYLHDGLADVPIDFRIIRDVTGKGRFARWEDVEAIADLDAVTEFYQPPVVEPDVFTVLHEFTDEGEYIGIVTAGIGDADRAYRAVFPFEVGYTGVGYWPVIVGLLVLIQLQYLLMSGRLKRWWTARRRRHGAAAVLTLALLAAGADGQADTFLSDRKLFAVQYSSDLEPIPINRMHGWEISVRTPDGNAVTGADISIDGGMPAHDHGLPTRPRVTEELGGGRYRVEGLRFHMRGAWEIVLNIETAGRRDSVTIPVEL